MAKSNKDIVDSFLKGSVTTQRENGVVRMEFGGLLANIAFLPQFGTANFINMTIPGQVFINEQLATLANRSLIDCGANLLITLPGNVDALYVPHRITTVLADLTLGTVFFLSGFAGSGFFKMPADPDMLWILSATGDPLLVPPANVDVYVRGYVDYLP